MHLLSVFSSTRVTTQLLIRPGPRAQALKAAESFFFHEEILHESHCLKRGAPSNRRAVVKP